MKKLSLLAAAALMATSAFAGDHAMNLQGRMSWINTDRDYTNTHKPTDSRIAAQNAYLGLAGKLNPATTYNLILDLASVGLGTATTNSKDNTSPFIDTLFVTRTLSEGLTLDIGKRALLGGGFEVTHASIDQYASSNYWTTVDSTGNQFGVTLSKTMHGHSLMLQTFNGNKSRVANGQDSQSRMGWAAEWLGDYSKHGFKTNIGYTVIPSATPTQSTNLLGAGVEITAVPGFAFEVDYTSVTSVKAGTTAAQADKKTTGVEAVAMYVGNERLTPFVKYFKDTYKQNNDGTKSQDVAAFGLGAEFKEFKNDSLRYHAVYTNAKTTPVTGTATTEAKIFIGAKIDVNIL